jgi:hypothetical protein
VSKSSAAAAREAMRARSAAQSRPEFGEAAPAREQFSPTGSAPAVRTRRVRRTVDLTPTDHAALARWCGETANELGVARVTGQDVIEALVQALLRDDELASRIRTEISRSVRQ